MLSSLWLRLRRKSRVYTKVSDSGWYYIKELAEDRDGWVRQVPTPYEPVYRSFWVRPKRNGIETVATDLEIKRYRKFMWRN